MFPVTSLSKNGRGHTCTSPALEKEGLSLGRVETMILLSDGKIITVTDFTYRQPGLALEGFQSVIQDTVIQHQYTAIACSFEWAIHLDNLIVLPLFIIYSFDDFFNVFRLIQVNVFVICKAVCDWSSACLWCLMWFNSCFQGKGDTSLLTGIFHDVCV